MMKESTKEAQKKLFYRCLKERPMTTKMAAIKTGIQRCNLTRFVAEFERRGIISTVENKKCEITHHLANYYSTEKKYRQPETQGKLFSEPTKSKAYQL